MTRAVFALACLLPAAAAAEGPLTAAQIKALVTEHARAPLTAWSADGRTFGVCAWMCGSREEAWGVTCSLGTVPTDQARGKLEPATPAALEAAGLHVGSGKALAIPAGARLEAVGAEDDGRCDWELVTRLDGRRGRVAGGTGWCFSRAEPVLEASPTGAFGAVFVQYAADHGCGDREGAVFAWPAAGAEAFVKAGLKDHRAGKLPAAIEAYRAALQVDPGYAPAHFNLGCAYGLQGKAAEAAEAVRWLLAHDAERYRPRIAADKDFDRVRADAAFVAALATPAAASAGTRTVRGTLRHTPIEPGRKSVEAYLGVEFAVEGEAGREVLAPSPTVPADALRALADQAVEVDCVPVPAQAPNPMEQAPLGADGALMARPARCTVVAIRAAR